jgi:hypothetical protein
MLRHSFVRSRERLRWSRDRQPDAVADRTGLPVVAHKRRQPSGESMPLLHAVFTPNVGQAILPCSRLF